MSNFSGFRDSNRDNASSLVSADKRSESSLAIGGDLEETQDAGQEERSSGRKRAAAVATTKGDFTEPQVPAQFKLPRDLVASLKLHAISQNRSMSDIVLDCLTSSEMVGKAWISSRKAG